MGTLNDPLPGCSYCLAIVQDKQTRRAIPNEFPKNEDWSAARIFHDACECFSDRHDGEPDLQMCSFCQHLRLRHLSFCVSTEDLPTHIPIPEPQNQSTCALCWVFSRFPRDEPAPRSLKLEQKLHRDFPQPLYLSITKWRSKQVQWRLTRTDRKGNNVGYLVLQEDVPAQGPTRPTDSNYLIPVVGPTLQDITRIKECISDCLISHEWCNLALDIALPQSFRLIDVWKECISSPCPDATPKYVALSYVWGDVQENETSKSTTATISELSEKIDPQTLPATIRDAIVVCKQLGERYLWVDRFCVLQDDEDDKLHQIQAMSAIFSAAKLVIVAASGSGMMDGLSGISRLRSTQFARNICGTRINVQLPPLWNVIGPSR